MPSLTTHRKHNTFEWYFESVKKKNPIGCKLWTSILLQSVLCALVIMTPELLIGFCVYLFYPIFINKSLYYLYFIIQVGYQTAFTYAFVTNFFPIPYHCLNLWNKKINYKTKQHMLVLIPCIIFNMICGLILFVIIYDYENDIKIKFKKQKDVFQTHSLIDHINQTNIAYLYAFIVYPCGSLFGAIICTWFVIKQTLRSQLRLSYKANNSPIEKNITEDFDHDHNNGNHVSSTIEISDINSLINVADSEVYIDKINRMWNPLMHWYLLLFLCIFIFFVILFMFVVACKLTIMHHNVKFNLFNVYTKNMTGFEIYFVLFLLFTSAMKVLLKKIARKIDIIRLGIDMADQCLQPRIFRASFTNSDRGALSVAISDNSILSYTDELVPTVDKTLYLCANINNCNTKVSISLEMFMEFFVSRYYYGKYRYIVFEYFSKLSFITFMIDNFLHVISEFCQSSVRFSAKYYDVSSKKIFDIVIYDNVLLNWLFTKDNCTLYEWRIRVSLDLCLRIIAFIISGVVSTFYDITYYYFYLQYRDCQPIFYTFVSILIDCLMFAAVFLVVFSKNRHHSEMGSGCESRQNENICVPFSQLFFSNRQVYLVLFGLTFVYFWIIFF